MVGNRPRETPRTRNARSKTTSTREMHALASISITSPAFSPARLRFASDLKRAHLSLSLRRESEPKKTRASPSPLARVRANHVRSIPNENRAFDAHSIGKKNDSTRTRGLSKSIEEEQHRRTFMMDGGVGSRRKMKIGRGELTRGLFFVWFDTLNVNAQKI